MSGRARGERGGAVVEAPLAICIVLLLGMGILTVTQVVWTHLDLASSVRGAARYAARAEYDPGSGTGFRRRSTDEVVAGWQARIADEIGVDEGDVDIAVGPDPRNLRPGDEVVVTITSRVTNPLYRAAAGITGAAAAVFGQSPPFDADGITVSAEAVTYVE